MKRHLSPLLLVLIVAWPAMSQAEALRCGNRLVYEGDSAVVVEHRCGQPVQISRSSMFKFPTAWINGRLYQLSDQQVVVPVETWIYNFGSQNFMRELRFEDGVLVDIKILEYGY